MKISQEFETKFETTLDIGEIENRLGIRFDTNKRQLDVYYDGPGAHLFLRGVFLRIRDDSAFQVKVNLDDYAAGKSSGHTHCTELEAPLAFGMLERSALAPVLDAVNLELGDAQDCFELFAANGLTKSVVIDKTRSVARTAWGAIYYDIVEGLGSYVEIEASDRRLFEQAGADTGAALQILIAEGRMGPIDTGYNALYWRKQDFEVYLKCPYVLKKDRAYLSSAREH